jgi:hypothetical protein
LLDFIGMGPDAASHIPDALISGQEAEAHALHSLHLEKNTAVWRPTPEQVGSAAFRVIVGDARYTTTGLVRGTVLDSVDAGLAEIKSGASELDSSYQLRLQTYRALVEQKPLTLYTNRPLTPGFGRWLDPHGVAIKPIPPEPEP